MQARNTIVLSEIVESPRSGELNLAFSAAGSDEGDDRHSVFKLVVTDFRIDGSVKNVRITSRNLPKEVYFFS